MSCGCGGECCKQPKGLGFIYTNDGAGSSYSEYNPDDYYIEGGDQVDWDALWYEATWGIPYDYWNGWYDPNSVVDSQFISDRLPDQTNSGWQQLVDWWRDFTGGYTGEPTGVIQPPQPSPSVFPEYSGYCPPNHYCVDYPKCTQCAPLNETPAQKAKREAEQRAKAAAQQAAAAALKKAQQAAQPCPPNTGLVKNQQGQCVCPQGLAFSKSQGKCVLISQLTAEDKKALEGTDWWKYLAIGAFVLIGVKALKK